MASDRQERDKLAAASGRELSIRVVEASPRAGCATISVAGCLDAQTADQLHAHVARTVNGGSTDLVFDLSELHYLSSTGIDCFLRALKVVRPRGGNVALSGATERVRGVISMYGFESTFPMIACAAADAAARKQAADGQQPLPPVQVFGQIELCDHLRAGGRHHTHCVSIGNPRSIFSRRGPDSSVPTIMRTSFDRVLRLSFYDVEEKRHLRWRQFPKRIPCRSDVKRLIRFFRATREQASGYTIHCWQGVSRSTAVALGFLYLMSGSEEEAKSTLQAIRPEAGPHQKLVAWFDQELGSHLHVVASEMRQERLDRWKAELKMMP